MRRLWTPRWVLAHAASVVLVVGFLLLGWWQVGRAASGNLLSFGYAIQWPAFAAFVVLVWIKEARGALRGAAVARATPGARPATPEARPTTPARRQRTGAAYDDSGDPDLAAYNRYLAWRGAHPHASPSEYPG